MPHRMQGVFRWDDCFTEVIHQAWVSRFTRYPYVIVFEYYRNCFRGNLPSNSHTSTETDANFVPIILFLFYGNHLTLDFALFDKKSNSY